MAEDLLAKRRRQMEARNMVNQLSARLYASNATPDAQVLLRALEELRPLLPDELWSPVTDLVDNFTKAQTRKQAGLQEICKAYRVEYPFD